MCQLIESIDKPDSRLLSFNALVLIGVQECEGSSPELHLCANLQNYSQFAAVTDSVLCVPHCRN